MPRSKGPRRSQRRSTSAIDLVARNRLLEAHMDLAGEIARGIAATTAGKGPELEDLSADGVVGLLLAAQSFEPERGIPFEAYARWRIDGAIRDGIRRYHWIERRTYKELRRAQDESDSDHYSGRIGPSGGTLLKVAEVDEAQRNAWWNGRQFVQPAHAEDDQLEALTSAEIQRLPERDRRLIHFCYGEERSLSDAARKLRFGRSWACRRRAHVLTSLRKTLERMAPGAVQIRRKATARATKAVRSIRPPRAKRP
jgi:RNA polymerase sigma factor for flagellar operon FliA